jgi:putative inorganic carbon (HCO3(-)) transporter
VLSMLFIAIPILLLSVLIVFINPFYGLLCVVFFFPFEQVSMLPGVTVVVPLGASLVLSWLIHYRQYKCYGDMVFLLFLGLSVAATLSLVCTGKYNTDIQSIIQVCVLSFLISQIIDSSSRLKKMIWVVGLSLLLNGIYTVIFGSPSSEELDLGSRESGLFSDPNFIAITCVAFFPPMTALFLHERNRKKRIALFFILVSLFLSVVFSFSRGAILASLVLLLLFAIKKRHILAKKKVIFTVLPVVVLVGYVLVTKLLWFAETYDLTQITDYNLSGLDQELARTAQLVDIKNYQYFSAFERVEIWIAGLQMFWDNAFFGVGFGQFKDNLTKYALDWVRPLNQGMVAHNSYIELLAELGILGAGFFMLIMFVTLSRFRDASLNRCRVFDSAEQMMFEGLFLGTIGYMIGQFFLSAQTKKYLWLLVGLAIAVKRIENKTLWKRRVHPQCLPQE